MLRRFAKGGRSMFVGACLTTGIAIPGMRAAQAAGPEIVPFQSSFSYTIDCGSVVLTEDVVAWGHYTYFISDGVITQSNGHFVFRGLISNPLTGRVVRDSGAWTERKTRDLASGDTIDDLTGVLYHITLPGQGVVVQATGRVVFDSDTGVVEFASEHAAALDPTAVCTALA